MSRPAPPRPAKQLQSKPLWLGIGLCAAQVLGCGRGAGQLRALLARHPRQLASLAGEKRRTSAAGRGWRLLLYLLLSAAALCRRCSCTRCIDMQAVCGQALSFFAIASLEGVPAALGLLLGILITGGVTKQLLLLAAKRPAQCACLPSCAAAARLGSAPPPCLLTCDPT